MLRELTIRALALATTASLCWTLPAAAQTRVGSQTIQDASMPLVLHHCQNLAASSVDGDLVTSDTDSDVTTREDLAPLAGEGTIEAEDGAAESRTRDDLAPLGEAAPRTEETSTVDPARAREDLASMGDAGASQDDQSSPSAYEMVDLTKISAEDCEAAGLMPQ
jgi:hypothetical protein